MKRITPQRAYDHARYRIRLATGRQLAVASEVSPQTAQLLAPVGPADPNLPAGPRVVLLDDCRDQVNFGASVLVDGIFAIVGESMPSAVIVPVPSHWLMDVSTGFGTYLAGGKGLRQPEAIFPTVADQFEPVADEWMSGRGGSGAAEFLARFDGADLVVLNGEGSIYRMNQSAMRELFLAWFAKERLGIPTVFVNGTIHLTDVVPVLPGMIRKTLPALDAVAVREPYSLRNVREFVPGLDVQLIPDSAFFFSADVARATPAVHAVRDQVGDARYFCFDPGAMPMDHRFPRRSALFELIMRLKKVAPVAVLVNSSPADGYIAQIASETDSIYVDTIADYREYMALVADAEFVVTGRYHNPILAAIMGTPSITFASANHKVHGACEMLGGVIGVPYDGTFVRPELDAIEQRAHLLSEERDAYRVRLQEVCERRRVEVRGIGQIAADALAPLR